MTPAFRALMNRHAMPAFERQLLLRARLGEDPEWSLSLQDGTAAFGEDRVWRVQLLGTHSEESDSWLWAWANEGAPVPKALLAAAKKVRAVGKKRSVEELEREELPLGRIDAHTLALMATAVAELGAYFRFPYKGGALYAALDVPELARERAEPERMAAVVREVLARWDVDPRLGFQNYAEARGASLEPSRERALARWPDGRTLAAQFDSSGRLTGLSPDGAAPAPAGAQPGT